MAFQVFQVWLPRGVILNINTKIFSVIKKIKKKKENSKLSIICSKCENQDETGWNNI